MQPIKCMTLDIENFHASVHTKQLNISMLEYARSFGATMKESIKLLTHWAAYCHTSNLGNPREGTIPFSQVAVTKPLPTVPMSLDDCEIMRGWASTVLMVVPYDKGLSDKKPQWQSLPEFMYQWQLDSGPKATFNFKEDDDSLSEDGPDQVIEREDMKHKTKLMNLMRAVTKKS